MAIQSLIMALLLLSILLAMIGKVVVPEFMVSIQNKILMAHCSGFSFTTLPVEIKEFVIQRSI